MTKKQFSKKDERLYNENKNKYKIEYNKYNIGNKIELVKKNKYGYYNFVSYLDSDEESCIEQAILQDIKRG